MHWVNTSHFFSAHAFLLPCLFSTSPLAFPPPSFLLCKCNVPSWSMHAPNHCGYTCYKLILLFNLTQAHHWRMEGCKGIGKFLVERLSMDFRWKIFIPVKFTVSHCHFGNTNSLCALDWAFQLFVAFYLHFVDYFRFGGTQFYSSSVFNTHYIPIIYPTLVYTFLNSGELLLFVFVDLFFIQGEPLLLT